MANPPLVVVVSVIVNVIAVVARGGACPGGRRQSPPSALQGRCPSCPPPSLARAEDGGARGDAILAVLVLEAVVVVAIVNSSKNYEPCGGTIVPLFLLSAPMNGVTTTLPEGKDMAGGGRGGHIVFPHPDNDNAGRLLDNVGSTNANDNDNNNTPLPPPRKQR